MFLIALALAAGAAPNAAGSRRAAAAADDGRDRARPDHRRPARDRDPARQANGSRYAACDPHCGEVMRPISFAPLDRPRQFPHRRAAGHLPIRRSSRRVRLIWHVRDRGASFDDRGRVIAFVAALMTRDAGSSCAPATSRTEFEPSSRSQLPHRRRQRRRSTSCSTPCGESRSFHATELFERRSSSRNNGPRRFDMEARPARRK